MSGREQWASRLGLVLAMAGNAVGLGNFLRFPGLCAQYGGGAFMIPYFVALLLLGIPLMWVEWSMGRYGGQFGYSTTPGMFARLWRNPLSKYLGALGVALPMLITVYYCYIESWCLAYTYYSVTQPYAPKDGDAAEDFSPSPISVNALKTMLASRAADQADQPLARADWTAAPEAFVLLDANADGALDKDEQKRVTEPLAGARTKLFLDEYLGGREYKDPHKEARYFTDMLPALGFWFVTVLVNCLVLGAGISAGIERLAKIAMPALFLFAMVLVVRVFTYQSPFTSQHGSTVFTGLNYIWQPNFEALANPAVWLAAAGQIFFTLSVGTGSIQCYASYMKKDEDCALSGLTTASTNEFCEVILGGSIAIPMAVAVFGLFGAQAIAAGGTFNLGFVAMPLIFEQMPLGNLFGPLWFALLFFAGITSSVALAQPFVAFMQDEFGLSRKASAAILFCILITFGIPVVVFPGSGYLDQMDFWAGTFGLLVFALLELLVFGWAFGGVNMWAEIQRGAQIPIPRFVFFLIRYVAPLYLIIVLGLWVRANWADMMGLTQFPPDQKGYIWMARASVLTLIGLMFLLTGLAWAIRRKYGVRQEEPQ